MDTEKTYDGRAVANFVLDLCEQQGIAVTNLALQKIVYFCHVWMLLETQRPLIRHSFEAWEFGPVLPYLYRDFKDFDREPISSRSKHIDPATGQPRTVPYEFSSSTSELLNKVVNIYGRMKATDLVNLSHVKGGPWHGVWNHGGNINPGMKIENSSILHFYSTAPTTSLKMNWN